jgi:lipopolysaccharide biosynthesis glycosyltransferase
MKTAFVTTLDDRFVPGFRVALNSLLRTTQNFNYDIIIIEWGNLSKQNKDSINTLYSKIFYHTVNEQSYSQSIFDKQHREWTYNCNFRFDVFTLAQYEQVVFFDSDIVFRTCLQSLLQEKIDFGAVPRPPGQILQIEQPHGFDAGLMVIGKKYLNPQVKLDLIEISQDQAPYDNRVSSRLWVGNEPILNNYFANKVTWLPLKYNLCTDAVTPDLLREQYNIQYIGKKKPWCSKDLDDQFDPYIIEAIGNKNGKYLTKILLKKLITIYHQNLKIT